MPGCNSTLDNQPASHMNSLEMPGSIQLNHAANNFCTKHISCLMSYLILDQHKEKGHPHVNMNFGAKRLI